MASKGILWIWLMLLAGRGLTVFSVHLQQQYQYRELQRGEEVSREMPASLPLHPMHHYRLHKVHTAHCRFVLLT